MKPLMIDKKTIPKWFKLTETFAANFQCILLNSFQYNRLQDGALTFCTFCKLELLQCVR